MSEPARIMLPEIDRHKSIEQSPGALALKDRPVRSPDAALGVRSTEGNEGPFSAFDFDDFGMEIPGDLPR
jgi:hypothetical protein